MCNFLERLSCSLISADTLVRKLGILKFLGDLKDHQGSKRAQQIDKTNSFSSFDFPGMVQEPAGQVEKAREEPAGRVMQKWLWCAVQWTHAALR